MIAQCTVDYLGRLTAHLPSARRLLLVKADGSVSVHADDRAYKPLNWMSPPCRLTEILDGEVPVWLVENKSGEQLRITITEIEHDSSHELGTDPGLVKDGVEAHLQELLAEHIELHQAIILALAGLKENLESAKDVEEDLTEALRVWIVKHIDVEDREYAVFLGTAPPADLA